MGQHRPSGVVPADSSAFSSGDSRDGVEQLLGNVEEWTATVAYSNKNGAVVLQGNWNGHDPVSGVAIAGGGYEDNAVSIPDLLKQADPVLSDEETGFRCVATA
jgi:formylglycine-generating enzyme required for sulfatase activity